ncbi:MAG TPA: hypothetical protein VMV46_02365 [Thermoanaerobaculia bacterium]|nr:hypothetical protein [Thermoanaerobaculia bacterium]
MTAALTVWCATALTLPAGAQVDQELAAAWFAEARELCERDAGRLWGVSLCGPMVIADAANGTIATNQPAPDAERPRAFGFANAAMPWGDERWSTFVWQFIPRDDGQRRARLMIHELFHRVQPELGLITPDGDNGHLDTLEGRTWLQLEWRALARALAASRAGSAESTEEERRDAISDALAFRAARRAAIPGAAENERREEIREGLAQYTGTVVSTASAASPRDAAITDALGQLEEAPSQPTFVRTFAYTSGPAYGLLLDAYASEWRREITRAQPRVEHDLGAMLAAAAGAEPAADVEAAAARYGAAELRAAERQREREHQARVAEMKRRFVDGPVLILPRGRGASFVTTGSTAIPGHGTTLSSYRVESDWGKLEAELVLISSDGASLVLPAPTSTEGPILQGDGWTVELAPRWSVVPGERAGDYRLERTAD